uniref:J domain-containing protein n=1 Tax=Ditylum brightwellii TaxID=49249 RepID=A0A6U3QJ97_9STRA|mmetsp:Transcript_19288/g.28790  ORF Transcript_19288/g.28790 Transcript_19288/m.28790 type:complete len:238 (+) Transcript_19288:101-814(+)
MMRTAAATIAAAGKSNRSYHTSIYAGLSQRFPSTTPKRNDDDENNNNKYQIMKLQQPQHYLHYNHNLSLQQVRYYHSTQPVERGAALVLGLGAVAATAKAGQYAVRAYEEWKASQPEEPEEKTTEDATFQSKDENDSTKKQETKQEAKKDDGKRENIFAKFFNMGVGSKYYEGGFEDTMTKREAALILGVRESSTPKRIKDAHRKLLILNHPDTGGSTYLSGKINEAKELLLKGKKM